MAVEFVYTVQVGLDEIRRVLDRTTAALPCTGVFGADSQILAQGSVGYDEGMLPLARFGGLEMRTVTWNGIVPRVKKLSDVVDHVQPMESRSVSFQMMFSGTYKPKDVKSESEVVFGCPTNGWDRSLFFIPALQRTSDVASRLRELLEAGRAPVRVIDDPPSFRLEHTQGLRTNPAGRYEPYMPISCAFEMRAPGWLEMAEIGWRLLEARGMDRYRYWQWSAYQQEDSSRPSAGSEVYAAIEAMQLKVAKSGVLFGYRLQSLEELMSFGELFSDERVMADTSIELCSFDLDNGQEIGWLWATLDTKRGTRLELYLRNPECLREVESATGLKFVKRGVM